MRQKETRNRIVNSIFITTRIYVPFLHRMITVMGMKKNLPQNMAQALDLPSEALSKLPVGTFRGKKELCIENHRGITAYSTECIRVAVKNGGIIVHGYDLTIGSMSRQCLRLCGTIQMIELE